MEGVLSHSCLSKPKSWETGVRGESPLPVCGEPGGCGVQIGYLATSDAGNVELSSSARTHSGGNMRPAWTVIAVFILGAAAGAGGAAATATSDEVSHQQARLVARSVLPSATFRAGSPPSGAFFTAQNRIDAAANGVPAPATGAVFDSQPVQGVSAVIPAGHGQYWALADNGYGTRDTSADWQLPIYRMDLGLGTRPAPQLVETVLLSDPNHYVPWKTVCDPTVGTDLPPFTFNVLPTSKPAACGTDPGSAAAHGIRLRPRVDRGRPGGHVLDR